MVLCFKCIALSSIGIFLFRNTGWHKFDMETVCVEDVLLLAV